MAYALYDYTESLQRVGIEPKDVDRVVRAWGQDGDCAEWEGGFVLKMKDGRFAYIWGWCDTTGWGCQDGAEIKWFDSDPGADILRGMPQHMGGYLEVLGGGDPLKWEQEWDEEPADLNRWHAEGCPDRYSFDA